MKTIVVVFMRNQNGEVSADKTLVAQERSLSPAPVVSGRGARTVSRLAIADKTPAPFWTWFIENPRASRA
jgi:hypothetical protein